MKLPFVFKDIVHKITVKFVPASLPRAKKPFYARAAYQPVLDIAGIAAKANIFKMNCDPYVIEEGLTKGMELIYYLAAAGYRIKTPLFNLRIRVPGEYEGTETQMPDGTFPEARLTANPAFRKYLRDHVTVEFDGREESGGCISNAVDAATGRTNEVMTRGNMLTIKGSGLKLESAEERKDQMGVFFKPPDGAPVKAAIVAWNAPKQLRVIVPPELAAGTEYQIAVETWSSTKRRQGALKQGRSMCSGFTLTAA